jgi:hypothetical protein
MLSLDETGKDYDDLWKEWAAVDIDSAQKRRRPSARTLGLQKGNGTFIEPP